MEKQIKIYILEQIKDGQKGCETMELYDRYSARSVNAAIRALLDEGKITISGAGYRLSNSTEYGVKNRLRTRNFDVKKA